MSSSQSACSRPKRQDAGAGWVFGVQLGEPVDSCHGVCSAHAPLEMRAGRRGCCFRRHLGIPAYIHGDGGQQKKCLGYATSAPGFFGDAVYGYGVVATGRESERRPTACCLHLNETLKSNGGGWFDKARQMQCLLVENCMKALVVHGLHLRP